MLYGLTDNIKKNYAFITSFVILILSVLTFYANFYPEIYPMFFNSDTVGMPVLLRDIFENHGKLKHWSFATPTLFPDVSLYIILTRVLRLSFINTTIVYGLIQVTGVTLLCSYIFKKCAPEKYKSYNWLIPLYVSLFFLEGYYFSKDMFMGFLMLAYSYHAGSFINCLIFLAIFVSPVKPRTKYILFFVLTTLSVFSDKLFIVMLAGPLFLSFAVNYRRLREERVILYTLLSITAGVAIYFLIFNLINNRYIQFAETPTNGLGKSPEAARLLYEQLLDYCKGPGFRGFVVIFTLLSVPATVLYFLRRRLAGNKYELWQLSFYVFFACCVFAAPIAYGNYSGSDTLRYCVSPFYYSALPFAGLGAIVFSRVSPAVRKVGIPGLLAAVAFIVLVKFNLSGLNEYINYCPPDSREIDSVAAKHHLKRGIAEYWITKKTIMFSKHNIKMGQVYGDGSLYEYGSSRGWYLKKEFDFVVANNLVGEHIKRRFTIRDTIITPHCCILVVAPFTFSKGSYYPFTLPPGVTIEH